MIRRRQMIRPMEIIVSMWPIREVAYRPLHIATGFEGSENNAWILESASPEKPFMLKVGEYEAEKFEGSNKDGSHRNSIVKIHAFEVANDLCNQWATMKSAGAGRPGVFVCPESAFDRVYNWWGDEMAAKAIQATDEWQAALDAQNLLLVAAVNQARVNHNQDKPHWNTEFHAACARALNIHGEPWQTWDISKAVGKKPCPFCEFPVTPTQVKCPQCREVINAERYAQLQARFVGAEAPAIDLKTLATSAAS